MAQTINVKSRLPIRIVLVGPPPAVTYGLQRGRGSNYSVDLAQTPRGGNVTFEFSIDVMEKAGKPHFSGDYVQGTPARRFLYIDVGTYAGQKKTPWSRRMIVTLNEITLEQIARAVKPGNRLSARINGTGRDGGPSCATVPIIGGWKVIESRG